VKNPVATKILAFAKRGGFFHDIDGAKLRDLRSKQGLSRQKLAEMLAVSSKAVSHYETKNMRASIENVQRLDEIFGESLVVPVNLFEIFSMSNNQIKLDPKYQLRKSSDRKDFMLYITEIIERTGYDCYWPKTSPFDVCIYKKDEDTNHVKEFTLIGGTACADFPSKYSNQDQNTFLRNVKPDSAIISDEDSVTSNKQKSHSIPYIAPKELNKLENPKEFKKMIIKRKNTS
jgi:predicted transcriptional regulator